MQKMEVHIEELTDKVINITEKHTDDQEQEHLERINIGDTKIKNGTVSKLWHITVKILKFMSKKDLSSYKNNC